MKIKNILFILGIIFSFILILIAVYIWININFAFSNINGQLYDGFGIPYNNGKPNSPYTILTYIGVIGGLSLLSFCCKNIKINKNRKN